MVDATSIPPALPFEACERSAVAAVLLGQRPLTDLSRELLSGERELAVYDAALAVTGQGIDLSPFTVRDYMGDSANIVGPSDEEWSAYCDEAPLPHMMASVFSALSFYRRKRAQQLLSERLQDAEPGYVAEILRQGLVDLAPPTRRGQLKTLADGGDALAENMATPGRRVPVPWKGFYDIVGSVGAGEVLALAALPGGGKSALAQQWAEHAAHKGHPVLFLSLEMLAMQLALRTVARCTGIDSRTLLLGGADRSASVEVAVRRHAPRGLSIIDDLDQVDAVAEATAAWAASLPEDGPAPLVVVDHLQHFSGGDKFDRVESAIRFCTETAKRHKVAVLALSQFANKDISHKRPPTASDLWGGMVLWQAASTVLLIHETGDRFARVRDMDVIVDKARNGRVGDVLKLRFEGAYAKFSDRK